MSMTSTYWRTTAVAALPAGWRNLFFDRPEDSYRADECPALLLQEQIDDDPYSKPIRTGMTRVVAATLCEGECEAAMDMDNFVATIAPGEDEGAYAQWARENGMKSRA